MISRAPEIAIYLCKYLRASFHRNGVNSLYARVPRWYILHEQTRIAATRLDDGISQYSSETSGPISNGRALKNVQLSGAHKIFWRSKGRFAQPPRIPLPTGLY